MKKSLLFSACAALAIGASAQAVLQDVTPEGYDFSRYDDNQVFPFTHAGDNAGDSQLHSGSWNTMNGAEKMAADGHFTVLMVSNFGDNSDAYLTKLNQGMFVHDFGGNLGKCLVFNNQWSPFSGDSDQYEHYGILQTDGVNPVPRYIYVYADPSKVAHTGKETPVRVRIVLNVSRRARHQSNLSNTQAVFGSYAMSDGGQNIAPTGDNVVASDNALNGSHFGIFQDETRNVAHIPDNPVNAPNEDSRNADYAWNPDRFIVYEYDTWCNSEAEGPIRILLWLNGTNSTTLIKEIKILNIKNYDEIAGGPDDLMGVRRISYRYYYSDIRTSIYTPTPELPSLTINGEAVSLDDSFTLITDDNDSTIHFDVPDDIEVFYAAKPAEAMVIESDGELNYAKYDHSEGIVIPQGTTGTLYLYAHAPYSGLKSEVVALSYKNTSGAALSTADEADVAPVYYNLQGVRVSEPANGLYIVRRGASVAKELVK